MGTRVRIRLKFNPALVRPALAPGDRRLWLFSALALRRQEEAVPIWNFEIYWKRLALGGAALAAAGYLGAVTALWLWLDRVPQNQVTWATIALAPVRWEQFREQRGDTAIALALERLRQRDYAEAHYGLRVGLARSPGHVPGRIALARLLNGSDPAQALAVLEAGLAHTPEDPVLLRALFGLYRVQQAGGRALEKTAGLLGRRPPLSPAAHRLVVVARANSLIDAGDLAGAEKALREAPPATDPRDGAALDLLHAETLVRLGRGSEARELLAGLEKTGPVSMELCRLHAELAIAEGSEPALEGALRRMKVAANGQPQAHLYAFQAWHRMKRPTYRERAELEFYRGFGGNDSALQLFAASAANLGLPDVVQRAQNVAAASGLSPFAFRVHLTELALRRGEFDEALRLLGSWERQIDTLKPLQRFYPEFIGRLARASVAGEAQQADTLAAPFGHLRGRASVGMYRLAAEVLERSGQPDGARQVVQLGLRSYPWSDPLLAFDQRLAQRAEATRISAAKTGADRVAAAAPRTAEEALRQLDALLAAGEFTKARTLLRSLRETPPGWLPSVDPELALREIRFAVLTLDPFGARAALRTHLERRPGEEDALRLARLAESLQKSGRSAEARLVHDEVAARHGGAPAVVQALASLALPDDLAGVVATQAAALAAIDRALAGRQPAEALRIHERLEQRPPAWRGAAGAELEVREVRMRLALDQRPHALAVWKDLVLRPGPSRAAAFKFVRDLLASGEEEQARLLAREVVRLLPGDPAAAKLQQEAEAPRPVD
ncbi:MAG: hypothetical protein C0502_10225 [Opitutus sp.]|nr:hypothetical protein [Opitutus sp.]